MMKKHIVVLSGDGIGPEVTYEAVRVIKAVGERVGLEFEITESLIGGVSLDVDGVSIKDEVIETCKRADGVFLGAVGGPQWDSLPRDQRPEIGLLRIRKELGLFTNLRPVRVFPMLMKASPLRREIVRGVDLLVVRELTGGIYFGRPKFTETVGDGERAVDTMEYRTSEVERIASVAFEAAKNRRGKVTSVDKANILVTSQLWRKTVTRIAKSYPDISIEHMLVDNCAMQLVRNPKQFDVLLTCNMFGDILSDEASMLTGSLGMLPSASLGEGAGLYEPVHGSAPDIAGKGLANPLAAVCSAALMYRFSFRMEEAAKRIEYVVQSVLNSGYRTSDLFSGRDGEILVSTSGMGDRILERIPEAFQ